MRGRQTAQFLVSTPPVLIGLWTCLAMEQNTVFGDESNDSSQMTGSYKPFLLTEKGKPRQAGRLVLISVTVGTDK